MNTKILLLFGIFLILGLFGLHFITSAFNHGNFMFIGFLLVTCIITGFYFIFKKQKN